MSLSSEAPAPSLAGEHARTAAHTAGRAAESIVEPIADAWLRLVERLDRERAAMTRFSGELQRALACRRGVTSLEYGILAGVLATVLFGGIQFFGNALKNKFLQEASSLS